ncbi:MAG: efflux RND transporter periplasmic adaptor subunit [Elusimicrobia bacterium]|nr:efflux RND transporter periplasmic adaptor subunit [Candidatus Obscuribacterium magneticum]
MKKKIIIIIPVLVLVVISIAYILNKNDFMYAGTIEATEIDISSRVTSVILTLEVKEGQVVKNGQTLVKLACEDITLAADIARKDYDRALRLFRSDTMALENYDRIRNKHEDAQLKLQWCNVRSPIDGTVLKNYHEQGELVSPGAKLMTVANLSEIYAIFYVPQTMLAKISLDMNIKGFLPELGMRAFDGRVSFIRESAEFTPKSVQTRDERARLVHGVKVIFPNPDGVLKPGMSIEAKLPE